MTSKTAPPPSSTKFEEPQWEGIAGLISRHIIIIQALRREASRVKVGRITRWIIDGKRIP